MGTRTLVVPLTAGSDEGPGLACAITVAKTLRVHIEAVFLRPDPDTAYVYTGMLPSDRSAVEVRHWIDEAGQAAAARARAVFDRLCREADVPPARELHSQDRATAGWRELTGEASAVFPAAARDADLALFTGAIAPGGLLFGNLLEATLLRSGNPVLFVPQAAREGLFAHPLIAFDGGTACSRAISAWLAMGTSPEQATILHIANPGDETPALDGIAGRLAWHGITARTEMRKRGADSVAEALLAAAAELGCGMLVMGGYGRFRYSEALFGGVTRAVIARASVPVLMMH